MDRTRRLLRACALHRRTGSGSPRMIGKIDLAFIDRLVVGMGEVVYGRIIVDVHMKIAHFLAAVRIAAVAADVLLVFGRIVCHIFKPPCR